MVVYHEIHKVEQLRKHVKCVWQPTECYCLLSGDMAEWMVMSEKELQSGNPPQHTHTHTQQQMNKETNKRMDWGFSHHLPFFLPLSFFFGV